MKKRLAFFLIAVLVFTSLPVVSAEAGELLMTIGDKRLYDGQSPEEIAAVFGQPRLITDSAFGGKSYTYYGENFADYLYLETDKAGEIMVYSTITPGFTTPALSYGDLYTDYSEWVETKDGRVLSASLGRYAWEDMEDYQTRWYADEDTYLAALQQHAVLMYNAVAFQMGYPCSFTFNERLFWINQQLKENGSDFYDYANATGQSSYVSLIMLGTDYSQLPTPLLYATYARDYKIDPSASYACFDYRKNYKGVYFVDPDILKKRKKVPLTEEEQVLLNAARREYAASVEQYNSAETLFIEDYVYDRLPLTAGRVDPGALEGAVGYLNTIRVAAGLPKLSHSEYYSNASQHKAVLSMYLSSQGIPNPDPHFPFQPDGVSDAFYELAQAGNGENLYFASYFGADDIIGSLQKALQEAYGDIIACGHRYNLLDPGWKNIGLGICAGQGVHKLNGYQENRVELVAWPSRGIMLTDLNYSEFCWTARFYSERYEITDSTTVEVKNLNTETSWSFTDENAADYEFYRLGSKQVTFYNDGITYSQGDVFQITLHQVLCDGQETDYTYRTVFERGGVDPDSSVCGLELDSTALVLANGTQAKLNCTLTPTQSVNKWVDWYSSDETIVAVSPNGRISAFKPGSAVITVTSQDGEYTAQCTVTVLDVVFGDINQDGLVNASDALLALQHSVRLLSLDGKQSRAADVSGEGTIDALDALLILQHSVGSIKSFPVESMA